MLCSALRLQFRQERDDIDIEELIRNRKQRPSETFDSFYDSVNILVESTRDTMELEKTYPSSQE